jgi:hypothetical protein
MKYFKTFEEFSSMSPTGVDDAGGEVLPKFNPKIRKEVSDFIDNLSPSRKLLIFKWLGEEEPTLKDEDFDEKFEKAKEKLVEFFESNPNIQISGIDPERFTVPTKGGDGISRTNNIGGTSHTNSFRIGESKANFNSELSLTEDDLLLFKDEEPLIDLIRNRRVTLSDKKVHFDKSDKETLDILDIYFEFDQKSLKSDETQ